MLQITTARFASEVKANPIILGTLKQSLVANQTFEIENHDSKKIESEKSRIWFPNLMFCVHTPFVKISIFPTRVQEAPRMDKVVVLTRSLETCLSSLSDSTGEKSF